MRHVPPVWLDGAAFAPEPAHQAQPAATAPALAQISRARSPQTRLGSTALPLAQMSRAGSPQTLPGSTVPPAAT